jgi:excisionase family DNA binding protein
MFAQGDFMNTPTNDINSVEARSDTTPAHAYSVADAVQKSGLGRTTLYALMGKGELASVKIGRRTLIRRVDLEDLIDRHLQKAA